MFTDMVGYTALMQEDEQKAKENRDRHRKILQELIAAHQGKILQYYGDGTLAIFNSAIEAVECATRIQQELQKQPKIPLRIGLHTGDIVYDHEGVYGDGVNIASRIEGLAISGSILISGKVYDDIKNHREFETVSLGSFDLKNVKKPVELYAIGNEGLAVPNKQEIHSGPKDKVKSLAVLPFVNMSPDPDNEYFSDGITEELLNVLAQVDGLQVTARTSSFAFKGKHEDIRQIGSQLGVKTILEGSVRKAGNRVRITAQLISVADGYHLWSESFDRRLDDIFEVQDEIALRISNRLREKLTLVAGKDMLVKIPTENIEVYNTYLKGLFHANKWTVEDTNIAIDAFQKAVDMEPDFALPWSGLANLHIYLGASGKRPPAQVYPKAKEYAEKAVQLDDRSAESHCSLASAYFYYEWDWDKTLQSLERAIHLNPSYAGAYLLKALVFSIKGNADKAIATMQKSIQLDPLSAPGIFAYASILGMSGRFQEAMDQYDKLAEISPHFPDAICQKGILYSSLGEKEKAKELYDAALEVPGSEAWAYACIGSWYADMNQFAKTKEYLEKLLEGRKSMPGQPVLACTALLYGVLDKTDEMFLYFNKSVEAKENFALFLKGFQAIHKYHSDPRFTELLHKMGLDN
jgi:TolB-like protein/Tfp pilus assembly protein PilF